MRSRGAASVLFLRQNLAGVQKLSEAVFCGCESAPAAPSS